MNKEEFEREALRIADERNLLIGTSLIAYIHVLRDLILKDLAENNPPVAWFDPEHGLPYGWLEEPPTKNAVYLYLKPPIQQAPEGWQLVPKETTPAMQAAALRVFPCSQVDTYRAMLSAAPAYKDE